MKNKLIIISLLMSIAFIACEPVNKNKYNDLLMTGNLYGPVKIIKESQWASYEKFGDLIKDTLESESQYFLSEKGYFDSIIVGKDFLSKFDKDEQGRSISIKIYNTEKTLIQTQKYIIDDQGRISEINEFSKKDSLSSSFSLKVKTKFKYDKNDMLKEIVKYNPEGNMISKTLNFYNEKQLLIEQRELDQNGRVVIKIEIKNDQFKNIIDLKTTFLFENSTPEIINNRINYIYDKQNNWIKKVVYINEKPNKIVERSIIYY
ncbi:hypothetical protein PQG22_02015 [Aquirufa beregesia]